MMRLERPSLLARFSLAAAIAIGLVLTLPFAAFAAGLLKTFYIPGEAMVPTLRKNDRLLAVMNGPAELRRGDVILVRAHDSIWLKRVAALPGDRIALVDGVVFLNGAPVRRRHIADESYVDEGVRLQARRLEERFPDEAASHQIYELEPGPLDEMSERTVRPGHVFLLGDNRDRSADSRVPRRQMGLEQVPLTDIVGRPWIYIAAVGRRFGDRINH